MDSKYLNLLIRANRHLGATLERMNLINEEGYYQGAEIVAQRIEKGEYGQACLLEALTTKLQIVEEDKILVASKLAMIDVNFFDIPKPDELGVQEQLCWATWTLPFERKGDYLMVASAYGLSKPAIEAWEQIYGPGKVVWYAATLAGILDKLYSFNKKGASITRPPIATGTQG